MRFQNCWLRRAGAAFLAGSLLSGCTVVDVHRWVPAEVASASVQAERAWQALLPPPWPQTPPTAAITTIVGPRNETEFEVDHPRVADFVNSFQTRRRNFFQDALERSGKFRRRMTMILTREGLPAELSYLPLIESSYRNSAVSRAGAAGPWQFVRETARRYGLRIDGYVDERRDPLKSTHAAARYLRDLHAAFGNWHLSLAAYNSGQERVARTLQHGVRTYWDMVERRSLPKETSDYVARFLAALQIMRAPESHGFTQPSCRPLQFDLVQVHRRLSFRTVAQMAGVSAADIAELNPALLQKVTPPDPGGYRVRVPKGTKQRFELAYAQMMRRPSTDATTPTPSRQG